MRTALKWTVGLVLALLVALALFISFGLNALKGPITRAVTDATGRELRIEGDLKAVWSWVHPRFRAEKVTFDNAEWASEDYMLSADAIEASVRLLPLLAGRVVVPDVHLEGAEVNLEQDAEGNANWILEKEQKQDPKKESRVRIERLTLDAGHLNYDDAGRDISIQADLNTDETGVVFATNGTYQGLDLSASGHAGHVLSLRDETTPFPLKGEAKIGNTRLEVDGTITGLIGLKAIDTKVELSGSTLEDLYWVVNVAFPATKAYSTSGRLIRNGEMVRYENFTGKVGESDIAGTIQVDTSGERPYMKGELASKVLNLADLGTVVGTDKPRDEGVLPDAPFDPTRWDSVDADVHIKAGTIKRPEQLPIENLTATIQMKDRVLTLNPLEFGIAGGKLAGTVKLDGTRDTIRADMRMRVNKLQLSKLFPTIKQNQASVGDLSGLIELSGGGNSVARMLGSANGKIGVFMDGGEISQFMMELVALDLWHAARVKLKGDKPIEIRCAIADFGVKDGVANTNAFVFDTAVVNVEGGGTINLKNEAMDIKLNPKPKDSSIASLNSPLYVRGTFSEPKVSPDIGRLAAKGVGAVLMGVVNPLLAVLPLLKEGKGKDSNCGQLMAEASTSSNRSAASGGTAKRRPSPPAR
ncbi:MAG TPA: AsmA family protein [Burkholderiales bacterium]|nr:AsmA family protein [Burkholderiales bacterium]